MKFQHFILEFHGSLAACALRVIKWFRSVSLGYVCPDRRSSYESGFLKDRGNDLPRFVRRVTVASR